MLINITSAIQPKWAPQARGPLCFAHAAQCTIHCYATAWCKSEKPLQLSYSHA